MCSYDLVRRQRDNIKSERHTYDRTMIMLEDILNYKYVLRWFINIIEVTWNKKK